MRFFWLLATALVVVTPASAQAPLPPALRSSSLTETQWSAAQSTIARMARETNANEAAVRNLAVEVFQAQPHLDFGQYLQLIEDGARDLQEALTTARALAPAANPELDALRQRAIVAAEEGRLSDAQVLIDDYNARALAALQSAIAAPLIELSRSYGVAAGIAESRADYEGAAQRWAQAATIAPVSETRLRLGALFRQANALAEAGHVQVRMDLLESAVRIYEADLIPALSRETDPEEWGMARSFYAMALVALGNAGDAHADRRAVAVLRPLIDFWREQDNRERLAAALINLGVALDHLGDMGDDAAAREAVDVLRQAVAVAAPRSQDWAAAQSNLGLAYVHLSRRGEPSAITAAEAAYRAAASVEAANDDDRALSLNNLGMLYLETTERGLGDRLDEAVATLRQSLSMIPRERNPSAWARTTNNLSLALGEAGNRGQPGAYEESIAGYRAVLSFYQSTNSAERQAAAQSELAMALVELGKRGDQAASSEAVSLLRESVAATSRQARPDIWRIRQGNLAIALANLAWATRDEALLRQAGDAFRQSLDPSLAEAPASWGGGRLQFVEMVLIPLAEQGDAQAYAEGVSICEELIAAIPRLQAIDPSLVGTQMAPVFLADLKGGEARRRRDARLLGEAIGHRRQGLDLALRRGAAPRVIAQIRYRLAIDLRDAYTAGSRSALAEGRIVARAGLESARQANEAEAINAYMQLVSELDHMR